MPRAIGQSRLSVIEMQCHVRPLRQLRSDIMELFLHPWYMVAGGL